jgi:diacylglycerol kinase family enzyme
MHPFLLDESRTLAVGVLFCGLAVILAVLVLGDEPPRPLRPVLFVNPRSGGGKAERAALADRARERAIDVIVLGVGDSLPALVDRAVSDGADALGVAGGDGSLAVVAAAARAYALPFVCVPAGTRNHFALDVGVDRSDLVGALDAFTDGVERLIDVAEVNGRLFLNNASLGVYGDAVSQPAYRDAKARTLAQTAAKVFGPGGAAADLELVDDCGVLHRDPTVVLVSNNPYSFEPPRPPGRRPALDTGRLGVLVLHAPAHGKTPGRAWTAEQLEVKASAPVHAGIDGEPVEVAPPLRFIVRPRALRVLLPRP